MSTPGRGRRNQVSISHLLNFTLPPRETARRPAAPSWHRHGSYVIDKAHFVNANFRFVVHPSGDYKSQALDPDVVVPWHLILQVIVSKHSQHASCPICLSDDPVASRMIRCGHIFCLPCLMRMLESEMPASQSTTSVSGQVTQPSPAKKRNACPLCLENVSLSDAKPVKWLDHPGDASGVPAVGADVVLRLVMRKPGSILALPRDGGERPSNVSEIPWHFAAEVMQYARIMKGTDAYIADEFAREVRELEVQDLEDGAEFGEDNEWNHRAIERIFDTLEVMQGMGNTMKQQQQQGESHSSSRSRRRNKRSGCERDMSSSSATGGSSGGSSGDAPYFFYQPRDASNSFLSALDIRILKTAFGSFASFPSTVLVRVEHIQSGQVVDEELKKRTKYLAHLPTGCHYSILECDWTDVVRPDILAQFKDDLDKRRKMRHDKDAKEERARLKALKQDEDSKYRIHGPPATPLHSTPLQSALSVSLAEAENDPELSEALRRSAVEAALLQNDFRLREISSSPITDSTAWPSLGTSAADWNTPSSSPTLASSPAPRKTTTTVWGTPAVAFSRVADALGVDEDAEDEDTWDGWTDAVRAVEESEAAAITDMEGVDGSAKTSGPGKKGKKTKKKLVLMSTGGQWRQ